MVSRLTTEELADRLETDPKTLRKFLRSQESAVMGVGKGHRYFIEAARVRTLRKAFTKWADTHTRQAA